MRCTSAISSALVLLCAAAIPAGTAWGQDGDPCAPELEAKTLKLIEKGKDKRKYDIDKRIGYLEQALEEQEEATEARFALGLLLFNQARKNRGTFSAARTLLLDVHSACPGLDADLPYTLGSIAFAEGDFAASMDWFNRFIQWEQKTGKPLPPRATRRLDDVRARLPEIQFLLEYNAHADSPAPQVLESVATRDQEYLPAVSADGTLLFFTRAGERKAKGDLVSQPFESFSWAKRSGPSTPFNAGEPMEDPFNKTAGYGGASISVDNRSLFLAIKTPEPGNPENIDLYAARYALLDDTGDETVYLWSEPSPLTALNTPRRMGITTRRESQRRMVVFRRSPSGHHARCARPTHHRHPGERTTPGWHMGRSQGAAIPHQYCFQRQGPLPAPRWQHAVFRLQQVAGRWWIRHLDEQKRQQPPHPGSPGLGRALSISAYRSTPPATSTDSSLRRMARPPTFPAGGREHWDWTS